MNIPATQLAPAFGQPDEQPTFGTNDDPLMSLIPPSAAPAFNPPPPPGVVPFYGQLGPKGYREVERKERATLATYQIVTRNDVMSLEEVANNFTRGNELLVRQMFNEPGAPEQIGDGGLFLAESVYDFFNEKPRIEGSMEYARNYMKWATPKPRGKFSLMVESAPAKKKVTIRQAAAHYFKGNETHALSHIAGKGLLNVHDSAGRYLVKDFQDYR